MKKIIILCMLILLTGCTKEYTVTFNIDEGKYFNSVTVEKGNTVADIDTPTKEGYIFVSWLKDGVAFDDNSPITEDTTLTASWTEAPDLSKTYNVIFDNNGETTTVEVKGKSKVAKPSDPTLKYYEFIGWYDGDTLFDFNTSINKDYYLTAKFKRITLKISFELNGGSGISERLIDAGKTLTKPDDPVKFGFKFAGWYLLGKEYNFDSIVTKDITLTATWDAIEYVTVKFDTKSDTVIKSQNIEKGTTATKPSNPVLENKEFMYWTYNGVEFDFNTKIEECITLEAYYKDITD